MQSKKKLIIIGSGGHAESCIDVVESTKKFSIKGLIDIKKNIVLNNYKVVSNLDNFVQIKKLSLNVLIAIGQLKSPNIRKNIFLKFKKNNFKFPSIISPKAIVSKYSQIGEGTIVMHGAYIGPNVKIGKNCIINTNAHLEHGVIIEDNCHISTSAILNGNVYVCSDSFIGSGSIILQNLKIKKNSFIKIGTVKIK